MKTCIRALLVYATISSVALAQGLDSSAPPDDPLAEADIGPHHRIVEWMTADSDADGNLVEVPNRYIELATGLNWWNPLSQAWEPSVEAFEITPKGYAVAVQGQHKLILAPNINEGGSVDLELPDGQRLRSNPMGLTYFDASSGKNVLLAEVQDCVGELVTPNVVIYFDCFDRIKGALRYTYTRSGMEQDVIILESIGSPALYGLDPDTTRLEMYTEFFDPPSPQKAVRKVDRDASPGKVDEVLGTERAEEELGAADTEEGSPDEELSFGSMAMGPGVAYLLNDTMEPVPVAKQWLETEDGRKFLSESVPYRDVEEPLERIEDPGAAILLRDASSLARRTVEGRKALAGSLAQRAARDNQEVLIAGIRPGQWRAGAGLVLDYTTILTGQTNCVLKGDETYYVTGPTYLYGTTIVEAGAVAKYAKTNSPILYLQGPVTFLTTPYRPAVFTAKDDNTVGQTINGSSGSPSGTYAGCALRFNHASAVVDLHHVRVAYANLGTAFYYQLGNTIRHCQFIRCTRPVFTAGTSTMSISIQNVLMYGITSEAMYLGNPAGTTTGEHLTLHDVNRVVYYDNRLSLTNSVLAAVTNWTYAFSGSNNATNSSGTAFQQVRKGLHYLANGSPYRNAGTTNISPRLLADLRNLTTYPPVVLSNDFTASTTLSPQAQRDTDAPDLGYHYDPLDYCWSALNLTNGATLTLTNGVAVGIYGTKGTILRSGTAFISEGRPQAMNRLVRYNSVQEGTNDWSALPTSLNLFELSASSPAQARLTFTDIPFLAGTSSQRQLIYGQGNYAVNPLALTHCQLRGAYVNFANTTTTYNNYVNWTNNLIERCTVTFSRPDQYYPTYLNLFNNLFTKGVHTFTVGTNKPSWLVRDNLFDSDTLTNSGTVFTNSHNGYRTNLTIMSGGSSNKTNLTLNFVSGPATNLYGVLGGYYYPTTGGSTSLTNLFDAGSRTAAAAGLYHFTATTNQAKEATSQVDIGYHYVALGANSLPQDTDGDGLPDYFEDRNGNGVADTANGETDWLTSNSGLSGPAALQVFTPLK